MKVTAYVRVGYDKKGTGTGRRPKLAVSNHPTAEPLYNSRNYAVPTVAFAIEMELEDALFERASQVLAQLKVAEGDAAIAMEVKQK